jgi:hypothetical protein
MMYQFCHISLHLGSLLTVSGFVSLNVGIEHGTPLHIYTLTPRVGPSALGETHPSPDSCHKPEGKMTTCD